MERVQAGSIYQHFKGNLYIIVTEAVHTETGEILVVYRNTADNTKTWVRPIEMFLEHVDKPEYNYSGPRFHLIRDWDTDYIKPKSNE